MDVYRFRRQLFFFGALVALFYVCRQGQSWPLVIGTLVVYVVAVTLLVRWEYVSWVTDNEPKTPPYPFLWGLIAVGIGCVAVGFGGGWLGESRILGWFLFPGLILAYLAAGGLLMRARTTGTAALQRRIGLGALAGCGALTGSGVLVLASSSKLPGWIAMLAELAIAVGLLVAPAGISLLAERAVEHFRAMWGTNSSRVLITVFGGAAVSIVAAFVIGGVLGQAWLGPVLLALAALMLAMASGTLADVFVVLGVIALMGVTPLSEPLPPAPTAANGKPRVLVAMGDSYMSGEGADTYYEGTDVGGKDQCRRAPTAWAMQAGDRYFRGTIFLACSGARTYNIRHDVVGAAQKPEPRPQDGEPGTQLDQYVDLQKKDTFEPALVVVTIGGNDAGFSAIGKACAVPGDCDTTEIRRSFIDELPQVGKELTSTFRQLRDAFPNTPIAATAYPDPIYRKKPCADLALTTDDVQLVEEFLGGLNQEVESAAKEADIEYIKETEGALAAAHVQLCDPANGSRPGVNFVGLRSVSGLADQRFNPLNWIHNSFHPNERGHVALLRAFDEWWQTKGQTLKGPFPRVAKSQGRVLHPQCDLVGDGLEPTSCRSDANRWIVQQLAKSAIPLLGLTLLVVVPAWLASSAFFGWRRGRRRAN